MMPRMLPAYDAPTLIVASALATIAVGLVVFALFSGIRGSVDLVLAGLFAGLYAFRMLANTSIVTDAATIRSSLEYIVPIPAAALFAHYFGPRWRLMNVAIVGAFVVCALVAIPYELLRGEPFALKRIVDSLVLVFMASFAVNLAAPGAEQRSVTWLRVGVAVFGIYVVNEHLRLVQLPWRLSSEPIGFLFFMVCVVIALIRRTVSTQAKLLAVETELETARRIQESIIPSRPPAVDGLDIAALYRPASHVGGDFYDFVPLPANRLGVFIADVSGHGVPAALVASMLKIGIAAQDHLDKPSAVIQHLNDFFCGRLKRQFFTAAYAVIDPDGRSLAYSSGGHPPMIVLRGNDRAAHEVTTPGFVVGRMKDASFSSVEEPFGAGDVAVLYTDGIVEATGDDGEQWGYVRLRQCVEGHRGESATEIAGAIVRSVEEWSAPAGAGDDLTLVVVRRATSGPPSS